MSRNVERFRKTLYEGKDMSQDIYTTNRYIEEIIKKV